MTARGPKLVDGDVEAILRALEVAPEGIGRKALLAYLNARHRPIGDSAMRIALEEARGRGVPVLWTSGVYKLAQSREEYRVWEERELTPRIARLSEERAAMRRTIGVTYPEQLRLEVA